MLGQLLSADIDLARRIRVDAKGRARRLRATRAHQARYAHDFACAHRHAHILELVARERLDLQQRLARLLAHMREQVFDLAACDVFDHAFHGHVINGVRENLPPVAQDGDAVADFEQLLQAVADVEHAHASLAQQSDDAEQLLNFAVGQRAGGLVKDDDLRLLGQRLGDLHHLLRTHAQIFDKRTGVHPDADFVQKLGRAFFLRPGIHKTAFFQLVAQKDVGRDGQFGNQVQLLIDHADTQRLADMGRILFNAFSFEDQLAGGGRIRAGKHLHQRGLACAVLSDKDVHLAGIKVYVDILQRLYARKALGYMPKLQ